MSRTSIDCIAAPNPWKASAVPPGPAAVLAALHRSDPRPPALDDPGWREALAFSDNWQLTLPLRHVARDAMPDWVRERVSGDATRARLRHSRLEELYRSLSASLAAGGVDFVALKGLTHCPDFGFLPEDRLQGDIDLYVLRDHCDAAREAVLALGYQSIEGLEEFPTDHLPTFIRKTGWQWRGDHFDPEIPIDIEVHFRFWNDTLERVAVPDLDAFWQRRIRRTVAGTVLPVLAPVDAVAYASLHLLRHVLHGKCRPTHVYEIACFLDRRAADDAFWREWSQLHSPELRRLQAVMFRLATSWFGGAVHGTARQEMDRLPPGTQAWFREFALSPAEGLFHSNKDELWLHLSLLDSRAGAWSVFRRRIFPERLPGQVDATHVPASDMSLRRRALKQFRYLAFLATRLRHHAVSLPRLFLAGLRWRRAARAGG